MKFKSICTLICSCLFHLSCSDGMNVISFFIQILVIVLYITHKSLMQCSVGVSVTQL